MNLLFKSLFAVLVLFASATYASVQSRAYEGVATYGSDDQDMVPSKSCEVSVRTAEGDMVEISLAHPMFAKPKSVTVDLNDSEFPLGNYLNFTLEGSGFFKETKLIVQVSNNHREILSVGFQVIKPFSEEYYFCRSLVEKK